MKVLFSLINFLMKALPFKSEKEKREDEIRKIKNALEDLSKVGDGVIYNNSRNLLRAKLNILESLNGK